LRHDGEILEGHKKKASGVVFLLQSSTGIN